jgi:uncharacterized Zn finger protein (UPF0148 family)
MNLKSRLAKIEATLAVNTQCPLCSRKFLTKEETRVFVDREAERLMAKYEMTREETETFIFTTIPNIKACLAGDMSALLSSRVHTISEPYDLNVYCPLCQRFSETTEGQRAYFEKEVARLMEKYEWDRQRAIEFVVEATEGKARKYLA